MANGGRDQIAEVAEKYRALRGDYEVMGRILTAVLRRMTAARGISAIVDARAKAIDSLIGKILRKPYSDPLEQLTDLCGARVVTDALSHVQPVCDYIRRHFEIDEANCVDKLATLGDEKFGYLSVHLIVSFRPGEFGELVKEMAEQERDREAFLAAARRVGALAPAEGDVPRTYSAEVQVRTVLQHAWAAIGHDRIYKSPFEVPEPLKRRANRLSAVLEEADEDLDRTIADIDAYRAYYGAYMTTAQMRERVRQLSITLQYAEGEGDQRRIARRMARTAACMDDWDTAVEALQPWAEQWRDSQAGQRLMEQVVKVLEAAADGYATEAARDLQRELRDPETAELLIDYGKALWRLGRRAGREWLRWASYLDAQSVDALVELGDTYEQERLTEKARQQYLAAVSLSASEPRALERLVLASLSSSHHQHAVKLLTGNLRQAIEVCRARAGARVYLPNAYYDIGFFQLILGEPYDALQSYAAGILRSTSLRPIETSLRRLSDAHAHLEAADPLRERIGWVVRLLHVARVAKAQQLLAQAAEALQKAEGELTKARNGEGSLPAAELAHAAAEATVAKLQPVADGTSLQEQELGEERLLKHTWPGLALPILMVAGGCHASAAQRVLTYQPVVNQAFVGFTGTVFGGATRSGICRLAAELPGAVRKIGYYPALRAEGTELDGDNYELAKSGGPIFSAREPLQAWYDLVAAGVKPADVKLLGINGGRTSAAEYRIALAFGAQVGLLADSGRAAADLLADAEWAGEPGLLALPPDVQTLRFFLHQTPPPRILREEDRLHLARLDHEAYVVDRAKSLAPDDLALRPWGKLPDYLKGSSLQKVDSLELKLHAAGLALVFVGKGAVARQPSPEQIEIIQEIEHGRWNVERLMAGWRRGPRSHQRRTSPYLVEWSDPVLDPVRQYDWDEGYPQRLADLGYEIRPLESEDGRGE